MSKKIVIVDNSTWNIYNFRLSLIKRLKANGYQVVVVAPLDEYIHYLNESYFTKHIAIKYLAPQSKNILRDLFFVWELFKIYKKEKPDLIIHYTIKPNIFGNIAARLANIPSISTITGLGYTFLNKNLINRQVPYLYKLAFKKVKKVVFYNNDDRSLLIQRNILQEEKGIVIPGSGVNTNHFRPLPTPKSEKFVFLFIGRLLNDKGLREYVEAARYIRQVTNNVECWVIGELNGKNPAAIHKKTLLEWVENKHIKYFGTAKDVRKYIKQASAIVLPSYREGIPRSILEAMAMAKPIVTTNTAGCKETVVGQHNGFLVPAKNAAALAESMLKLYYLSQEQLFQMGQNSRIRALAYFDDKIITSKYLKLVNALIYGEEDPKIAPIKPSEEPNIELNSNYPLIEDRSNP